MGKLTQSTAEIQEILNGYNALKEQVEKLAPTPDWSAEYGAHGFIANKPISLIHNKRYNLQPEVALGVYDFNRTDNYVYVSVQGEVGSSNIPFFFNGCIDEWEANGDVLTHEISIKDGSYRNTVYIEVNTLNKTVTVYDGNVDGINHLYVTISEYEGAVMEEETSRTLPDECIPDSIARKSDISSTPAVNEALMKYLGNPYVITTGEQIPEDLHNLIFEEGRGLKPVVMLVCVMIESGGNMKCSIESYNAYNIYSVDGQESPYNHVDRVFE